MSDEDFDELCAWYDAREHYDPDQHGARARFVSTMRASITNLENAGFVIRCGRVPPETPHEQK